MSYMHLATKSPSETCGYCNSKKENPGSATYGIGAPRLSVVDYQKMMDRGFRRCGNYVYKYDLEQSCCQPYTIRLDVTEFQISQSQKKVLKKFYKFLQSGDIPPPKPDEKSKENKDKESLDANNKEEEKNDEDSK